MPGPAAPNQEHDVEAQLMGLITRVLGEPEIGSPANAGALLRGDGGFCRFQGGALLDLDEREAAAPHGDEIDLAEGRFFPAPENAVAAQAQRQRRDPFRMTAEFVSGAAFLP